MLHARMRSRERITPPTASLDAAALRDELDALFVEPATGSEAEAGEQRVVAWRPDLELPRGAQFTCEQPLMTLESWRGAFAAEVQRSRRDFRPEPGTTESEFRAIVAAESAIHREPEEKSWRELDPVDLL